MEKEIATFAAGCFWCVEAIFKLVKGVESVTSGYTGGNLQNPTYEQITSGTTGHAEATQIVFNPNIVTFEELVNIFFLTHDPTTLNRQGSDVGTQYRSAIFYHNEAQKTSAEKIKKEVDESKIYKAPIVTSIEEYSTFYTAEDYHQNFYDNNKDYPYCKIVIDPKVKKFKEKFLKNLK